MDAYERIEKALKAGHMVVARVETGASMWNRVRILRGNKCSYARDFAGSRFGESCFAYGEQPIDILIRNMKRFDISHNFKIEGFEIVKD